VTDLAGGLPGCRPAGVVMSTSQYISGVDSYDRHRKLSAAYNNFDYLVNKCNGFMRVL
jgi:hypothetical protein